ncbi:MAG: ribosomal protein L7/L12 [Acidobacteriota bacterium]
MLEALHSGRKIEAIKLLRERQGLGLKEAKQAVDRYAGQHPDRIRGLPRDASSVGSGWVGLTVLVVLVVAGYGLGSFFGLW